MTSPAALKLIRKIDAIGDACGRAVSLIILPMIAVVSWEVLSRYAFGTPTIWAFDLTYMLYGGHFMLGCAYALLHGSHVRADMLWEKFSARKKGLIDTVAYLVFFFPSMVLFFVASADDAWHSFKMHELSEQTAWRPVLWPFKAVVPVTAVLLLIQGISETIKSVHAARTGEMLSRTEAHLV